jgi:hypothetical protein
MRFAHPAVAALILLTGLGHARAEDNTRVRDVVYGHKFGMALTLDVLRPARSNGAGVIFMVSGGFKSDMSAVDAGLFNPRRCRKQITVSSGSRSRSATFAY